MDVVVVEVVEVDAWLEPVDAELPVADEELVVVVDVVLTAGPRTSVYEAMFVAACWPGLAKEPTANPSSIEEPATRLGNGSYGEAPLSLNGL